MPPDALSSTFAALADPTRRAILARLLTGDATVTELAEPFDMSLPAVSKHLKVLERAGLITRGRQAQWRPCQIEAMPLRDAASWIDDYRQFWEQSFDRLDTYFKVVKAKVKPATAVPRKAGRSRKNEFKSPELETPMPVDKAMKISPFVISRIFDAPRELVFAAFTEPARMKDWWGPKGFTVIAQNMDLRPGGIYHYGLRSPTGQEVWGKFLYREIVRPERIVLVNCFSDAAGNVTRHPMAPTWPLENLSTFLFEDAGERTKLSVIWEPINASAEEIATFNAAHESMSGGWKGTMDQLAAYLASAKSRQE